jgi:hypothetical protein
MTACGLDKVVALLAVIIVTQTVVHGWDSYTTQEVQKRRIVKASHHAASNLGALLFGEWQWNVNV